MNLEMLAKVVRTEDTFHPMDHMDWETWSGANPGTYISHDEAGHRVIFVEPTGVVAILYVGENYEDDTEFNFQLVQEPLDGFDDLAVQKNRAYHDSIGKLPPS